MSSASRTSAATLDDLVAALRRGDVARAEKALADGNVDPDALIRLAELNARRQRFADAAWLFDRAGVELPPAAAFSRNLCRNMTALAAHRPAIAAMMAPLTPSPDVSIVASSTGHPTVAVRQPDGSTTVLSTQNRPLAAAESVLHQLRPALAKGLAIGLAGVGDGYLLYRLAIEQTKLFLDTQIPVFVIEPDPQLLRAAMMIHDYSAATGPIAQHRFAWFVGPDWASQLRGVAQQDLYFGAPAVTVGFTAAAAAIRKELAAIGQELNDTDTARKARIEAHYAGYDPAQLADLLQPGTSRRPRVLLPTTRFSTVLQYSNHDTARALQQLGWEVRELIEPSPAHRMYQTAIRAAIDDFRPDLVLQIDHLRYEHGDLFPPNLPFVCWAQDHLPNLVGDAGKHVGPNDFVLTDGVPTYVRDFHYPASQCIGLPKLTSVTLPMAWACTHARGEVVAVNTSGAKHGHEYMPMPSVALQEQRDDVVFVSNASRDPAAMLAEKLAEPMHAAVRSITEAAAARIQLSFADSQPLTTYVRIRELVESVAAGLGISLNRDAVRTIAAWLYHPYCDAIYRQQALGWAADACGDLGLSLGLYGKGWEAHPTLSPFARGPVANGPDLHDLTRRSLINLQIVPYLCLHQRLLDGLCAGGFFLIREHAADIAPQAMLDLLTTQNAGDATTVAEAQAAIDAAGPAARGAFASLLQDCRDCLCNSGVEDPIEYVQSLREIGFLLPGQGVLPRFGDVSFAGPTDLREKIARYSRDADARQEIAEIQRRSVAERFTYVAGMSRVVRAIAERLSSARSTDAGCHGLAYSPARGDIGPRHNATGSGVPQPMAPETSVSTAADAQAQAA